MDILIRIHVHGICMVKNISGQSHDEKCQSSAEVTRNPIQPQQFANNTWEMCAGFDISADSSIGVNYREVTLFQRQKLDSS